MTTQPPAAESVSLSDAARTELWRIWAIDGMPKDKQRLADAAYSAGFMAGLSSSIDMTISELDAGGGVGAIIPCRCPTGTRTQELCMDKRVCSAVYPLSQPTTPPAVEGVLIVGDMLMTTDLASLVAMRLREYASLRDAGRKLGVCHVWLHRLATGQRTNASDELLAKLRIKRTVTTTYEETK